MYIIEEIALEIADNLHLEKLNLKNLRRVESSGPVKIKITRNSAGPSDEEKQELLERLGLTDEQIVVENACLFYFFDTKKFRFSQRYRTERA